MTPNPKWPTPFTQEHTHSWKTLGVLERGDGYVVVEECTNSIGGDCNLWRERELTLENAQHGELVETDDEETDGLLTGGSE